MGYNPEEYVIGKGVLYIGEWTGSTPPTDPGDFVDVGNCPVVSVEPVTERLPHYSSRAEFRNKDKNPITQQDYNVNITADQVSAGNIARFVMGTVVGDTIRGFQASNKEYALKFVSNNPIGPNSTWKFHKVTMSGTGDLALIGEEWQEMTYLAEGLVDTANNPNSPYFDVQLTTTTTTTTTT